MKKVYMTVLALASLTGFAQTTTCNTVVINDTEEQNGTFISGQQGQRAAADIPITAGQEITISQIKVTLASKEVPTYINFRFYDNILGVPEDPEVASSYVPNETLFDVTNTTVGEFEVLAYDEMHDFYIRNITVNLAEPIHLNGDDVEDRYWMGVLSDANAWASTAHYLTGEDVVGESLAMGAGEWFQLKNLEQVYELTAECNFLGTSEFNKRLVSLSPNPATDVINISLPDGVGVKNTSVYTVAGQLVHETAGDAQQIDVAPLAKGVYVVKVAAANNAVYNNKFIKN